VENGEEARSKALITMLLTAELQVAEAVLRATYYNPQTTQNDLRTGFDIDPEQCKERTCWFAVHFL